MVFDWFQRRSAQPEPTPAESDPASPIESDGKAPEPSALDEPANAQSPEPEPSIPASQPTVTAVDQAVDEAAPTAAEAASTADVDDDPLEWARQAYARLKAQQAAEAEQIQTPVAPKQPSPKQPSPEQPSAEEVSEVASPESPVSTASSATPLSTPIVTPESSSTPAPRLSLLEQAAA